MKVSNEAKMFLHKRQSLVNVGVCESVCVSLCVCGNQKHALKRVRIFRRMRLLNWSVVYEQISGSAEFVDIKQVCKFRKN